MVSRLLNVMGMPVYFSDVEARNLMLADPVIHRELTVLIGPEAYIAGQLNKPLIAAYLFSSTAHAAQVNAIVHPRVREDFRRWAKRQAAATMVGMESAILIEAGFRNEVDRLVVVTAPMETRILRTMRRDNAPRESVEQRIRTQITDEQRIAQADFVIVNDGIRPLIPQVVQVLHSLG